MPDGRRLGRRANLFMLCNSLMGTALTGSAVYSSGSNAAGCERCCPRVMDRYRAREGAPDDRRSGGSRSVGYMSAFKSSTACSTVLVAGLPTRSLPASGRYAPGPGLVR